MKGTVALLASGLLAPALLLTPSTSAAAVPGGEIGTLEKGKYVCEIPGDGSGASRRHVPAADFSIITASSYRAQGRNGTYLLTGDRVVMTSGPFKGQLYRRQTRGLLRLVDKAGHDTDLRCVLTIRGTY